MGRDGLAYTVNSLHLRSCVTPGQWNAWIWLLRIYTTGKESWQLYSLFLRIWPLLVTVSVRNSCVFISNMSERTSFYRNTNIMQFMLLWMPVIWLYAFKRRWFTTSHHPIRAVNGNCELIAMHAYSHPQPFFWSPFCHKHVIKMAARSGLSMRLLYT